jgi:hypothetical protein
MARMRIERGKRGRPRRSGVVGGAFSGVEAMGRVSAYFVKG